MMNTFAGVDIVCSLPVDLTEVNTLTIPNRNGVTESDISDFLARKNVAWAGVVVAADRFDFFTDRVAR